jgi:hypothetical protein
MESSIFVWINNKAIIVPNQLSLCPVVNILVSVLHSVFSLVRVRSSDLRILSRVLVTKTGFGLVIGFINHLEVVTAINYHTLPDFRTTNHSTLSLS